MKRNLIKTKSCINFKWQCSIKILVKVNMRFIVCKITKNIRIFYLKTVIRFMNRMKHHQHAQEQMNLNAHCIKTKVNYCLSGYLERNSVSSTVQHKAVI